MSRQDLRASSDSSCASWKSSPINQYYTAIKLGNVTVGKYIRQWYERVIRGLESGEYAYSEKAYNRAARFIESFAHHHEGQLAPQLIKLELWQKAFLAVIFGILDETGVRQFREVLLVIARKNGKTLLAAAIAEYMTLMDGEYGSRVYFCAPKLAQAGLCYNALCQMITKEPEISDMVRKRRTDIYCASTNSTAEPIAFSAKKSDGMNPHLVVCDEIASWAGDAGLKQYEVLKSALGARTQPMILSISTSGYVNEGIYDELIKRGTSVINGTSKETRLAPFLYMIDDIGKWNDQEELKKSNPNLGVSVPWSYLQEEIAVAETSISKKVEFLTKYANVKQSSSLAWFSAQTVKKAFRNNLRLDDFRNTYALAGIDLSQTTDLTSACVLIEREKKIFVFSHFWLPSEKLIEATERDGIPYQAMVERGFLTLSGDNFVDYKDCFVWFTKLIEEYQIYPLMVGYDRYSAQYLVQDLETYGFHMESVYQGYNLTQIEDNLEGLLRNGTLQCGDDNDLLKIHFLDSAQQLESNTNAHPRKKLVKINKRAHVDGVAAILDALCMRQNHWADLGDRLKNEG